MAANLKEARAMLAVVQRHELGGDEHVLPLLLEAYPVDTVGQLHYFLVFWCQAGRDAMLTAMGEDLVGDMLALLSEYGVDPDRCRLEESDGDEDPSIGPPPDWFRRNS
jgi:hypothetical protein